MSETSFYHPQRQSAAGVVLIFATTLYKIIKNFWAVGLYLIFAKADAGSLFFGAIGLAVLAILILVYSVLYFLRFQFFINEKSEEFVLQKGVFSSDVINIPFHKIQHVNFKRNILQRVIGVYSVVIDTAGSGEEEVEIQALSKERADELAELLMEYSEKEKEPESLNSGETKPPSQKVQWKFELGFSNLIKLGLTSHLLRGLAILVAFYSTLQTQFGWDGEYVKELPSSRFSEFTYAVILIIFLLMVSILVNIGEAVIKYYNLNLQQKNNSLQIEMGLRNNTRVNLKASRVQLLQETVNPVHKWLDLYKLKISLASSRDALEKTKIAIPGLPMETVAKVKNFLYGAAIEEYVVLKPNKILLYRMIFRRLLPIGIAILAIKLFSLPVSDNAVIFIGTFLSVCIIVFQFFSFKKVTLFADEIFLVKQSGLWSRKKQFLEMYKLQSVSIRQPIWYKKDALVNITFHAAGGDIEFPLLNEREAKNLMNYLLYKIESTAKPWM